MLKIVNTYIYLKSQEFQAEKHTFLGKDSRKKIKIKGFCKVKLETQFAEKRSKGKAWPQLSDLLVKNFIIILKVNGVPDYPLPDFFLRPFFRRFRSSCGPNLSSSLSLDFPNSDK